MPFLEQVTAIKSPKPTSQHRTNFKISIKKKNKMSDPAQRSSPTGNTLRLPSGGGSNTISNTSSEKASQSSYDADDECTRPRSRSRKHLRSSKASSGGYLHRYTATASSTDPDHWDGSDEDSAREEERRKAREMGYWGT